MCKIIDYYFIMIVAVRHRDPRPTQALGPVPYWPWAQSHAGPGPRPIPALGKGPAEKSGCPAPFLELPSCTNKRRVLNSER